MNVNFRLFLSTRISAWFISLVMLSESADADRLERLRREQDASLKR